ncbi:hypothetical protein SDRG_13378 [Saprolegnia diclina VS20]|uniref:Uncharacterized protein n=1 Tax=Saprolegnia diclina (strain VS20) TaxID=1156394 RepID=T0R9R4_SAPDV|nr:hypothetical protein SDRG_13378 [Saprolegnia diclina VS20]EQC28868.1 hypothetical protein SDRG_13378 [Saprolegnia diclina VS20]|eukprot:XP_008617685.1 hypothetical protein SDRG_13378 [Saprolegnia diclina VS20]
MADQHAGLGLMAEATMSQQKLRSLNPALQSSNGSQSFLVPAPMPPYIDVTTKESLMSAIQTLQPLLTKQAVSAYPSHILDLAVQCIAALPAETSAVVAEVQKLRYVLANQVQINMAPSMMPMYAPVPSYASAPITSKPPPHSQNWVTYPTRPSEMPMAGYATMGHTGHPTATNAGFGTDNMPRPSVPYGMARTTNPSSTEGMTAMTQTSTMASPSELPLRDAARSHVGMDQVVSFTSSTQASGPEATLPLHTTLTTSTTALSDLPRSMASTSKDWDQPASFGSSASGIQSMAAITPASTAT